MSEFTQVTVVKAANLYFDGRVSSRTVLFADGSKKTLGLIMPGEYSFDTADREVMELLGGSMEAKLPGHNDWVHYGVGESFEVPANAEFSVKVSDYADYCCSYLK